MPPVISTIVMSGLFARRQRTSMSAYFTNSLTPPARLGLLASLRGGALSIELYFSTPSERWRAPRAP